MKPFLKLSRPHKIGLAVITALGLTASFVPLAIHADTPTTSASATTKSAALPTPSVVETALDPVVATIDGIPVDREKFNSLLMATAGPGLFFRQVLPLVVVQEACEKAGIEIKPEDIQAEKDRIIKNVADQYPDLKDADRQRILNSGLQRQGITNDVEFFFFLQRAAYARALAKGKADPTDTQVQKQWDADNADKVAVLDILVPDIAAAADLRAHIKADTKTGDDLAQDVQQYAQSKNYRMGQTVFSRALDVNPPFDTLKTLAMGLHTGEGLHTGDLSASTTISEGEGKPSDIHVMYCIKTVAATNKTMSTKDRDALKAKMTEAMESQWAEEHMRRLMAEARVEFKDKTLKTYYDNLIKQSQEQRDAAASQAATQAAATATAPAPK